MRPKPTIVLTMFLALTLTALPAALADGLSPVGPVTNGDFELGSNAAKPVYCAAFGEAYLNVFEPGNPLGLPWLVALKMCKTSATHWSHSNAGQFDDFDGDGDREAAIFPGIPDPVLGENHNMWQAYPSPHQAFTANFDALEFDIEHGAISNNGNVKLSLSTLPLEDTSGIPVVDFECQLTFNSAQLTESTDNGHVSADPTEAQLTVRKPPCADMVETWNDEDPGSEERGELLGRLRIVQLSFWSFEAGPADDDCGGCAIQIDNVALTGATTVVDEIAAGNVAALP